MRNVIDLPVGATFTTDAGTPYGTAAWTIVESEPDEASGGRRIAASRDVGFGVETINMVCLPEPSS